MIKEIVNGEVFAKTCKKKMKLKKIDISKKKVFQKNLSFIQNALTRFSCKASMITLNESDLLLYN